MNLLDYHRLRREEQEAWDLPAIEEAVREQDPAFPERVHELLQCGEDRFWDNLRTVERGPLFEKLAAVSQLYLGCSPQQRTYMRSRLADRSGDSAEARRKREIADRLGSCGLRAAVVGLREGSLEMVKAGLAAFAIADLGADVRETLMSITVLFHAAKRLGANAAGLFQEVAAISGPAFSAVLIDFANRPEGLQTLACMGWHEVETPQGPGFQWGWLKPAGTPERPQHQ
ncbi:MAG: hypothetical protein LAP39_29875 [Acidobacteriia bacterium]|nr:hypothetical protein [Terriglobia bacterium]